MKLVANKMSSSRVKKSVIMGCALLLVVVVYLKYGKGGIEKKTNPVSEIVMKESYPDTLANIPFGKIENLELFYDCIDCRTGSAEGITIYAVKDESRIVLANILTEGFYINDVKLMELKNQSFILVSTKHTSGQSEGKLYSLNTTEIKLNEVLFKETNFIIPDSLYIKKGLGLSLDEENNFIKQNFLRSENTGNGYLVTYEYEWIKIRENENELTAIKMELSPFR